MMSSNKHKLNRDIRDFEKVLREQPLQSPSHDLVVAAMQQARCRRMRVYPYLVPLAFAATIALLFMIFPDHHKPVPTDRAVQMRLAGIKPHRSVFQPDVVTGVCSREKDLLDQRIQRVRNMAWKTKHKAIFRAG